MQKMHVGPNHKQLYQLAIFFVVKMETLSLGSVRHLLFLHHARYLGLALWFWILRASCQKLQLLLQIHLVTSDKIFQNRLALTLHY